MRSIKARTAIALDNMNHISKQRGKHRCVICGNNYAGLEHLVTSSEDPKQRTIIFAHWGCEEWYQRVSVGLMQEYIIFTYMPLVPDIVGLIITTMRQLRPLMIEIYNPTRVELNFLRCLGKLKIK